MIFVCATPVVLRGKLPFASRLYAYPSEPEPPPQSGFTICDSGAYGLSKRNQAIDFAHMKKLNAHYQKYEALDDFPRIAVAPDQYLSPSKTMRNWHQWHDAGFGSIAPVIQCRKEKEIDLNIIQTQINFYAQFQPPFIFFSNPALRGIEAQKNHINIALDMIRAALPKAWIHILGAGWDLDDIAVWRETGPNSIDTIAYYTAAQSKTAWGAPAKKLIELSQNNAIAAINKTL